MDKITDKTRKEYLENFGTECPFCGSEDISTFDWDFGIGEVWSRVRCYECKEVWIDVYKLTGVEQYD
jgi:transcription elongation factor Elf1